LKIFSSQFCSFDVLFVFKTTFVDQVKPTWEFFNLTDRSILREFYRGRGRPTLSTLKRSTFCIFFTKVYLHMLVSCGFISLIS
jgi:hypothetical protein